MTLNLNLKPKTIRRIHSYFSLIFCFILCFYLVTGFFLNHPTWFETEPVIAVSEHSAPVDDTLPYILNKHNLQLSDALLTELEQSSELELSGPGRRKVISIEDYIMEVEDIDYGVIATLNDLHKNRHVHVVWTVVSDVFIFFTLLMCLTGVWISLKNIKKKNDNIKMLVIGGLILLVLILVIPSAYSSEAVVGNEIINLEAVIDIRQFEVKTENPYLAVFSKSKEGEYKTHFVLKERYKWVKDLKTYWRKIAREDRATVDAHSGATRKAGVFTKTFELSLPQDQSLSDVVFYLEIAREKGSREIVVVEDLTANGQICVQGTKEISKFCLQRMK